MDNSHAWSAFLSPETLTNQQLAGVLIQAHDTMHNLMQTVKPLLWSDAVEWSRAQKRVRATLIVGFLVDPRSAPLLIRGLLGVVVEKLPFTSIQWTALDRWVREGEDGLRFLGNFLIYLMDQDRDPSDELIRLFATFRSVMRRA